MFKKIPGQAHPDEPGSVSPGRLDSRKKKRPFPGEKGLVTGRKE
jgi:hypothetical protein